MKDASFFEARKLNMQALHTQVQVLIADALQLAYEGKFASSLTGLNSASNFLEENADAFSRKHLKYLRLQIIKARDARLIHMYRISKKTPFVVAKKKEVYSSDSDNEVPTSDKKEESNTNNNNNDDAPLKNEGKQEVQDNFCKLM